MKNKISKQSPSHELYSVNYYGGFTMRLKIKTNLLRLLVGTVMALACGWSLVLMIAFASMANPDWPVERQRQFLIDNISEFPAVLVVVFLGGLTFFGLACAGQGVYGLGKCMLGKGHHDEVENNQQYLYKNVRLLGYAFLFTVLIVFLFNTNF